MRRSKSWMLAGVLAVALPAAASAQEERQKIEPRGGLIELFRSWGDEDPKKEAAEPKVERAPRRRAEKPEPAEKREAERPPVEPEPERAAPAEAQPSPEEATAEPEAAPERAEEEDTSAEDEPARAKEESQTEPDETADGVEDESGEEAAVERKEAPRADDADASAGRASAGDVRLPEQEILGELEKPGILFLLPRARDRSDEQIIRSRLRREITKPLIKEWLEESLLLE